MSKMELIQQLDKWNEQAEAAGEEAEADFGVAQRLMKHGLEALNEIERLRAALREIRDCETLEAAKDIALKARTVPNVKLTGSL
jgi:hypothetical protein